MCRLSGISVRGSLSTVAENERDVMREVDIYVKYGYCNMGGVCEGRFAPVKPSGECTTTRMRQGATLRRPSFVEQQRFRQGNRSCAKAAEVTQQVPWQRSCMVTDGTLVHTDISVYTNRE
ncbi:MAG: hypothetical protein ACYTEQ_00975 [Planctomycetota bacterium]